jgi:anthranilate/para-aminobenzoate synthase component II
MVGFSGRVPRGGREPAISQLYRRYGRYKAQFEILFGLQSLATLGKKIGRVQKAAGPSQQLTPISKNRALLRDLSSSLRCGRPHDLAAAQARFPKDSFQTSVLPVSNKLLSKLIHQQKQGDI